MVFYLSHLHYTVTRPQNRKKRGNEKVEKVYEALKRKSEDEKKLLA